jgi:hypothetical protein
MLLTEICERFHNGGAVVGHRLDRREVPAPEVHPVSLHISVMLVKTTLHANRHNNDGKPDLDLWPFLFCPSVSFKACIYAVQLSM